MINSAEKKNTEDIRVVCLHVLIAAGRFVTSHGFHMGHGHTQYGQFIRLASQSATRGYHVTEFIYVRRHFRTTSPLNFTVTLP